MTPVRIWLHGFLLVSLVAWNVRHVANGEYLPAFFTGSAISICWWLNARLAAEARTHPTSALWYGLGAGCGTVMGMWLGS
jgi:hypothetical protein